MLETLLLALKNNIDCNETDQITCKEWLQNKKFKSSDLVFLNILNTDYEKKIISDVFRNCVRLNSSFSDSLQILELATELVLINIETPVLENSNDLQSWKNSLKSFRYPQSAASDQTLKTKLESLSWPHGSKVKFERRGDRAGIELKVFITGNTDLAKIISSLERIKEEI
jgi:hypothetical protein